MFNQANLAGNVGKDPEVRYTTSGKAVATFPLATSKKFKDNNGQMKEETQWHRIVVWGKLAEIAGEYVKKGSQVLISGEITYRKYTKDSIDHFITEIVADTMKMLGGRKESGNTTQSDTTTSELDSMPDIPF